MRRRNHLRGLAFVALTTCGALTPAYSDDVNRWYGSRNRLNLPPPQVSLPPDRPTPGTDPSMFSLADSAMATITGGALEAINKRLTTFRSTTIAASRKSDRADINELRDPVPNAPAHGFTVSALGGWSQVFGLSFEQTPNKPFEDSANFAGATVGFDLSLSQTAIAGFFFGGSSGTISEDDTEKDLDTNGFYGGFYLTRFTGSYFVDVAISGGMTEQDTSRFDFELTDAKANYSSYFVNPSLRVSTFHDVAGQLVLPSISLAYSGYFYDGYNESGSTQSLSVDDRQTHLFTGRAEVSTPYDHTFINGSVMKLEAHGGVQALVNLSDGTLAASQRGTSLTLQSNERTHEVGFFLGTDISYVLPSGLLLYGELEGIVNTRGSIDALAQFGTRFSF